MSNFVSNVRNVCVAGIVCVIVNEEKAEDNEFQKIASQI